jgi:hypothetical protein
MLPNRLRLPIPFSHLRRIQPIERPRDDPLRACHARRMIELRDRLQISQAQGTTFTGTRQVDQGSRDARARQRGGSEPLDLFQHVGAPLTPRLFGESHSAGDDLGEADAAPVT